MLSFILTVSLVCIGINIWLHGKVALAYCLLVFFLSSNVLVCLWEICLYFERDFVERRADHWKHIQNSIGRAPAIEYLMSRITITEAFSSRHWADAWAAYSVYDQSYVDRRTYGFIVDVGNGFVTLLPSIFLLAAYTVNLVPAVVVGIVGLIFSWQWIYGPAMYIASFFVADRHKLIPKRHTNILIWGVNLAWMLFGALGAYVSVRLVLENDYAVLGH